LDSDIEIDEPFLEGPEDMNPDFDDTSSDLYTTSKFTAHQTLALLFSWFSAYPGINKEAFSALLYLLHYQNPLTYSGQEPHSSCWEYHCCINDCILYRDCVNTRYEHLSSCSLCGENRYKEQSKKRFKYIPLLSDYLVTKPCPS